MRFWSTSITKCCCLYFNLSALLFHDYPRENPLWENAQHVVQSEIGDVSYVEFFIPSFRGLPAEMQHLYGAYVKDGYWVNLHIVKALYKPEEHEIFERIIKSIKFESKSVQSQKQE